MRKRLDILVPLMALCATMAIGATVTQMANLNQFNSGEVSGLLEGRTDYQKYNASARTLQNMIVRSQGPVQRRPGLKWIAQVKDSTDEARLIPFEYSTEDSYAIELGDEYARFYRDGAAVLDANSDVYEIVTPWDSNDLFDLQYAQDAEYLRVVHPNYAPYKVWRASDSHTDWRCEKIQFVDGPFLDENTEVGVTLTPGSTGAATGHDFYLRPEEGSIGIREPSWYGQTFTTSAAYSATGVKVKILRVGALPGEATLSIRATAGGLPTGADLASATFDANSLTTNVGGEWIEFVFASPLALSNATQYAIILKAVNSTTSDYIRWRVDFGAGGYTGGNSVLSIDGGSVWSSGTADFIFDVSAGDIGSSTTSTTLNASAEIFNSLHVGSIWQVSHQEDGATIRGTFTTTEWLLQNPGAADQNSASIDVYEDQDYVVTCVGYWAGTLLVQRSVNDGTTWDTVYAYTKGSQTEPGLVFTGNESEEDAIYRLQMKDAIGYRPHRNDFYLSFPYTMISLPFTRQGVVEITGYTDPNTVDVSIRKSLGSASGTATWAEGAWSDYRGWPRSIEYHEQRCLYGGSKSWPQTIWASVTGTEDEDYDDFDEGIRNDPDEDDAWTYVLPGMSPIQWMRSADYLMVGTTKAIGRLGTETESITPLVSPPYRTQAKNGSAYIQPVDAVDALLFVERGGQKVRELTYTYASDRFVAPDMTILAEHITGDGLVEIAFQNRPDPILWAIREDGYALSFTYEQKQEVRAWARHNTGQDVNDWNDIGLFESVAVIPGSGTTPAGDPWTEDAVYFVVHRTIDGNDLRQIEMLTPVAWGDDEDYCWFVDGGWTSTNGSTGTAETGGAPAAIGNSAAYTMAWFSEVGAIFGVPLGDRTFLSAPDAAAVTDEGGGIVGIAYTAHPFASGDVVRIYGSTNYDGDRTLTAGTTADQLQFSATYQAETFDGTEQIFQKVSPLPNGYGRFVNDSNAAYLYYGHVWDGNTYVTRFTTADNTLDDSFLNPSPAWPIPSAQNGQMLGMAVTDDDKYLYTYILDPNTVTHGRMSQWTLSNGNEVWRSGKWVGETVAPGYDMCIDDSNNAYGIAGTGVTKFAVADGNAVALPGWTSPDPSANILLSHVLQYDSTQDKLVTAGYAFVNASAAVGDDLYNCVVMDTDGTDQVEIAIGGWYNGGALDYTPVVKHGCLLIDGSYIYALVDVNGTTPTLYKYDFAGTLQASMAAPAYGCGIFWNLWGDIVLVNQDSANAQSTIFYFYDTSFNQLASITSSESSFLSTWTPGTGNSWIQGAAIPDGTISGITFGVDVNYIAVPDHYGAHGAQGGDVNFCVYADGIPIGTYASTVDPNGTRVLNLAGSYSTVIAGINYYSIYESLPLVNSETQGKITMLKDVLIDYYETMGSHVGTSYTYSADLKFSYDNWATGIAPYSGFKGPVGLLSALNRDPTIYIWEWTPVPMCIRSIHVNTEVTLE